MTPPPEILARLEGDGVTSRYLVERLGISLRQAKDMMRAIGAQQSTAHWRLPNRQRVLEGSKRWNSPADHSGSLGGEGIGNGRIGRVTNRAGAIE